MMVLLPKEWSLVNQLAGWDTSQIWSYRTSKLHHLGVV
jgi:hypothetical protein